MTKVHNNLEIGNPGPDAQNPQPAPDARYAQEPDQTQADGSMPGLPPPGPAPDQNPNQAQDPAAGQNPLGSGSAGQAPPPPNSQQPPYPPQQGAYPQQGGYPPPPPPRPQYQNPQYSQYPQYPPAPHGAAVSAGQRTCDRSAGNAAVGADQRAGRQQESQGRRAGAVHRDPGCEPSAAFWRFRAAPRCTAWSPRVKKVGAGSLAGSSELALTLTSLDLGGRNYPTRHATSSK